MASPTRHATALALKESLAELVAELGADLEDVEVTAAGRRNRIRVVVDADAGIDLDAIAAISQAVSAALDDQDRAGVALEALGPYPYTLEVTSPGVDRPLTLPRHWRRNVSRLVEITLVGPTGPATTLVGRITAADDTHVTVDVDGEVRDIPLSAIDRATIRIEFTRPDEGR